jgi:protein-disulfide isomerase
MKRLVLAAGLLLLAACTVDTTGVETSTKRQPHPRSTLNAAVTVVEYADLQCPACRAAHTLIVQPLLQSHDGVIRYEFRHFPLSSIHRNALGAAQAAECAADQGKFWEYVDMAFEKQTELSPDALKTWAEDLELDMELFGRCTKSGIKKSYILDEYDAGRDAGVSGTPTFLVNGTRVVTDLAKIKEAIDGALKGMGQRL